MIKAVLDFFEGGRLPGEVNSTIVSLIPKVPMAESLNHLRPISCCNFIYKVVSKIVVTQMKGFIGDIISPIKVLLWGIGSFKTTLLLRMRPFMR